MTILYFDCFSGASGDMILGALVDAGVPLAEIRRALGSLAIDPAAVWTERVVRAGISATRFCVRGEETGGAGVPPDRHHQHAHDHDHHHGPHVPGVDHGPGRHAHAAGGHHHPHRTLAEIYGLIDGSALSASGKARAKALFERLGRVEAAIHGIALDEVHLHEVGALDSIIDIVGAVFALETLGAERIVASPLNVGSGTVRAAHGVYPVPAPATVKLLEGVPMYAGPQQAELVTPTGALLVSSYASAYGP
ncbi:MAG TPA: LarC family nickel insertion protein, partial [Vicinamibacterales bacterium]|nr:LarC family nickel insertion protein [Vicinamibacterales bacterium]